MTNEPIENTDNQDLLTAFTPASLVRAAIRAVPAVKWALAVGAIATLVGIVLGFQIEPRIAVFGTIISLGLMTIMVVFAALTKTRTSALRLPVLCLTWVSIFLISATAALLFTSYFFNWPRSLTSLAISVSDAPVVRVQRGAKLTFADLPQSSIGPIEFDRSSFNLASAIVKAPSLRLEASTLDLRNSEGRLFLKFARLEILQGSTVIVGNRDVTIVVGELVGSGGKIRSYLNGEGDGQPGADATAIGQQGFAGANGQNAGNVQIIVLGSASGATRIELSGGQGGIGGSGGIGVQGAPGATGVPSSSSLFDCRRGGGQGERGHAGQSGAVGGQGGKGGNGGNLTVVVSEGAQVSSGAFDFSGKGGIGARGGAGGVGGAGGPGGAGGRGSTHCHGGANGPQGEIGPNGPNGTDGIAGTDGSLNSIKVSAEELSNVI